MTACSHNPPASGKPVSYCKKPGHEREEIEGACYQCADTFCKYCIEAHRDHYLIFFQDSYLKNNYASVNQLQTGPNSEPPIHPPKSNAKKKSAAVLRKQAIPVTSPTEEPTDGTLQANQTASHLNSLLVEQLS